MKVFIALVASLAVASGFSVKTKEPEGCEVCRTGMNMLYSYATTTESIERQVELLDRQICQNEDIFDPEGCTVGVQTWWPQIASIIFNDGASPYVCAYLNNDCEAPAKTFKYTGWDCETCKADLQAVADLYRTKEAADAVVEALTGPAFCEGFDIDEEQLEVCKGAISKFMPAALDVLFTGMEYDLQGACYAVYDGICEAPTRFWL